MKTTFFILLFMASAFCFSQNNYIVKTEDGRRVLLKADFTWEYIDAEPQKISLIDAVSETTNQKDCGLGNDFKEPKLDQKIQNELKRGRATINDVKKKVAKDNDCTVDEIVLVSATEKKENAIYNFCANGKKVTYKRVGNSIIKNKFF